MMSQGPRPDHHIWWYAFGYFAAYVPYSALTKAMSSGQLGSERLVGLTLLPVATLASIVGMTLTITLLGWWRYASHTQIGGLSLPHPGRWTLLSGLCTGAITITTTLAYTFSGASIVFMMILMRGGVLMLAPLVDSLGGRKVRISSWVALLLSLGALVGVLSSAQGLALTVVAAVDVVIYLLAYFIRLRFMTRLAKGHEEDNRRFFVEEQMIATPAALLFLGGMALVGGDFPQAQDITHGFTQVWFSPLLGWVILIGILSQLTGVFGGLVLLDGAENSYCVPVNRASSVLAGLAAAYLMATFLGSNPPPRGELMGATMMIGAILVLTLGPRFEKN